MIIHFIIKYLNFIYLHFFIHKYILQSYLATLSVNKDSLNEGTQDHIFMAQKTKIKKPNSLSIYQNKTMIFGIARLLKYSAEKSITDLQHPLKKKLFDIFKCFSEKIRDKNFLNKTVEEILEFLHNAEDTNTLIGYITRTYFFRTLHHLSSGLTAIKGSSLQSNYMKYSFLYENFVLVKWFGYDDKTNIVLENTRGMLSEELLNTTVAHTNFYKGFERYSRSYPKYLYFFVKDDDYKRYNYINLDKEYKYEYVDQSQVLFYKLVGFLNVDDEKIYSYLKVNNRWKRFINNKEVQGVSFTNCPIIVLFEK